MSIRMDFLEKLAELQHPQGLDMDEAEAKVNYLIGECGDGVAKFGWEPLDEAWHLTTGHGSIKLDGVQTMAHITSWLNDQFVRVNMAYYDMRDSVVATIKACNEWHFDSGDGTDGTDDAREMVCIDTVTGSTPSGKYYAPFAHSNVNPLEAGMDILYAEMIEELLESYEGYWLSGGGGSAEDVFLYRQMDETFNGEYVTIDITMSGTAYVTLTEDGKEYIKDNDDRSDMHMWYYLTEDIQANSSMMFTTADQIGGLSECECILLNWDMDSHGHCFPYHDAKLYTNINWYQIDLVVKRLQAGTCIFHPHSVVMDD